MSVIRLIRTRFHNPSQLLSTPISPGRDLGRHRPVQEGQVNRTVALKFLPSNLTADDEATARLVREAQAAAAIDHPNICAIYEISETHDGQTFIVMGYYGGATLREVLEGDVAGAFLRAPRSAP